MLDERVFPFLGILKVAAFLEQNGIHVDLLDLSGVSDYEDVVKHYCLTHDQTLFGVTATTPQIPAASKILRAIKEVKPNSKVILGGTHITLTNAAYKLEAAQKRPDRATKEFNRLWNEWDCLIAGDGEFASLSLFNDGFRKFIDADLPKTDFFLKDSDLNELPLPARHLLDMDSYKYYVEGKKATSAIFQLGCPYSCFFCSGRDTPFLRRIRKRTSKSILDEIKHLAQVYGYQSIMIYDDEINVNPAVVPLMYSIADLGLEIGSEFRLRGFLKAELFNEEQAKAMYEAGFRWILTGFESGSPRILENTNKKATREDNTRCVEIARKHGLKVKALMSFGHPGESEETIKATEDWLLEMQPEDFDVTTITPYPGAPYFDRSIREKDYYTYTARNGDKLYMADVDYANKADYYKGIPGEYVCYVWSDYLSSKEIAKLRDEVETNIRSKLNIPFNEARPGIRYETSMGATKLPPNILRSTA